MKTKFYILFLTFFSISFSTFLRGQNTISITNPPTDLVAGENVDVTVAYTMNETSAYILVRLINPNGSNPQDFITKSGSGSHTFSIPVPDSPGNGYRWQAQLLRTSDWGGLSNQYVDNVSVGGSVPSPAGENSISFDTPPTTLTAGQSVSVTVNYATSEPSAYVLVRLINPNGSNPQDFVTKSGSGNHTFTITAPDVPGSGYRWQAQLLRTSDWGGLDNQYVDGITISNGSQPPAGGDRVSLTDWPNSVELGGSYDVSVSYNVSKESVIYVQLFDREAPNANGNWNKIGSGSTNVGPGSGNAVIPDVFINRDVAASNRLEVLLFHPTNGDWGEPIAIGDVSVNVTGNLGQVFGERDSSDPDDGGMRYYQRRLEGRFYNGEDQGNGSGVDHTLAPTSKIYRSNWWVNSSWQGPIKSYYGEGNQNGRNFWVEWQNLGEGPNGHGEFDIRVEKSNVSDNAESVGFPSRLGDITQPLEATFSGRWTAGSTGRAHINMTAWVYNTLDLRPDRDTATRCDIIIHAWDNSGDYKKKYEVNYRWALPGSDVIFYFDKIGTASSNGVTYDVLRTMPGGFGEGASYNLIPTNWRREFITEFPTRTINSTIDVNKILKDIIELERANGPDSRQDQNGNTITANLLNEDWGLHVMEWTVTGQSGSYVHDPAYPNDFDKKVFIPNSKGRFTFDRYTIASPCEGNPSFPCPSNSLKAQLMPKDSLGSPNEYQDVSVSPNPFITSFAYEYSVTKKEPVSVDLYALDGRKVKTLKSAETHRPGNYSDIIDTGNLDAGIYILRISSSEGEKTVKLIKN